MAVYVDGLHYPGHGRRWCHLVADSGEELDAMAELLGLRAEWKEDAGTPREHFDLPASHRELAISHGALPVTRRELARLLRQKREVTSQP
ncbi:MAG TPA: DUF4031 domain-containing protein [Thermomicrobiaceae bacterium]|nr:DUF4031 domain-containing protein [Thermomicrobiaceae bacterium]